MNSPFTKIHPALIRAALAAVMLILVGLGLPACRPGAGVSEATTPEATASPTLTPRPATRPVEIIVEGPAEVPEVLPTLPLPGQKVLETEHFAFYVEDGYRPVDLQRLARKAEDIYNDVSADMVAALPEGVILSFRPPEDNSCPARGMAFLAEPGPRIIIFADESTDEAQILGVLAHELAHVIHGTGFDQMLGGDRNLSEGLATWFSRDYWTAWHQTESLAEMVRGYLATGEYVPLAEADVFGVHPQVQDNKLTDCLDQRDLLYTEWASFVGYLVKSHGWETFVDLMASAAPEVTGENEVLPSPTDYESIYGKTLKALEADWLAQIRAGS